MKIRCLSCHLISDVQGAQSIANYEDVEITKKKCFVENMKITEYSVMGPFENMMYYTFDRHMTDSSFRDLIE